MIPSFDEQVAIWGYAIVGDDVMQQDAQEAEHGVGISWDLDAEWLRTIELHFEGRITRAPDWFALPHLPIDWREQARTGS